ncbi:serine O-acetyltransferase [Thermodesulfobacteriota bacterium]
MSYILDMLFYSIKTRCCIDLFYEIELGKYFLPAHAISSILGRAQYSDYLVVTQHCTIGNNKGYYPRLGRGVILRSGAQILGNCIIGDNVTFAANSLVIDSDIPADSIVFGQAPNIVIKENSENNINIYFER